jgi:predicted CoA-substrate-specific enzyme activase
MIGEKIFHHVRPTGWSPREVARQSLDELLKEANCREDEILFSVGTGYGRVSLPFVKKTVTEISCHARGAVYLVPGTSAVIDIGGQDSKVIKVDPEGKVLDFVMNDRCAAGTGRFLQVMAAALGLDVADFSVLGEGKPSAQLNSMCAVFAESEVVGLLAAGCDKEEIINGLHDSIARRIAAMAHRLNIGDRVTFTGGVAKNEGLRKALEKSLQAEVRVPELCHLTGALGAALIGRDRAPLF